MSDGDVLAADPPPGGAPPPPGGAPPPPQAEHPNLINENPTSIVAAFGTAISFCEAYGWYLVFSFIFVMVVWSNIEPALRKFFQKRKRQFDLVDTMTPEQVEERMMAMDRARQKMQENYDRQARDRAEKRQQLEEEKRLQRISDHEALKAGKTQSHTQRRLDSQSKITSEEAKASVLKKNKDAKPMRPSDYNPLTGTSSAPPSARYRPGGGRGPARGGG